VGVVSPCGSVKIACKELQVFSTSKLDNPEQMASAIKLAFAFIFMMFATFSLSMNNFERKGLASTFMTR